MSEQPDFTRRAPGQEDDPEVINQHLREMAGNLHYTDLQPDFTRPTKEEEARIVKKLQRENKKLQQQVDTLLRLLGDHK